MSDLHTNFIRQQGFDHPDANTCAIQYPALMFQPRVLAVLVLAGVALQAPHVFLTGVGGPLVERFCARAESV